VVEHSLGKGEVVGSIPTKSSIRKGGLPKSGSHFHLSLMYGEQRATKMFESVSDGDPFKEE
jgi:hypothetical protein